MKLSAALLVALAVPAADARPVPRAIPAALRPFYESAAAECRTIAPAQRGRLSLDRSVWAVRRIDLNGDGKPDYVLNRAALVCDTALTLFCGTGGCGYGFALSAPGGYRRQLLQGRALAIAKGKLPVVELTVHGDECGRAGAYDCHWQWRWNGKKLAPWRTPR